MSSNVLFTSSINKKLALIESECHQLLVTPSVRTSPQLPARDVEVRAHSLLPPRLGLQSPAGQARLLHDLANIELQAMELGLRTLYEFPHAPKEFRSQLVDITLEEAKHLKMCLDGIENLGYQWGQWPVHMGLWGATSHEDSLVERVFIVNCYLEGSGLDSSEILLQKLSGVMNKDPRDIVKVIADEEKDHVRFGLRWLKELNVDKQIHFAALLFKLKQRLPPRAAKIAKEIRREVGFNDEDLNALTHFNHTISSSIKPSAHSNC